MYVFPLPSVCRTSLIYNLDPSGNKWPTAGSCSADGYFLRKLRASQIVILPRHMYLQLALYRVLHTCVQSTAPTW